MKAHLNRCDLCGKFRLTKDLAMIGGENDEEWIECRFCCSKSDLETYFTQPRASNEGSGK